MKKRLFQINFIVFFMIISWWIFQSPEINGYLTELHIESVVANKTNDPLYKQISERAAEYEIPPQDAKVDRVWKAIPGYNGLTVDINGSYIKMKNDKKFSEKKLVFQQVKPSVRLKDLPPTAIYKGHPDKPMVSLIINVAWGNEYIPGMLSTLKAHHVKATFFLEGRWVKENPELAKMIVDAGHEVGNHSYTHADFKRISMEKMKEEIVKTNGIIHATTGETTKWFAPPSGSYRDEAVTVASQNGLGTIMWTVDTIDWKNPPVSVLINRVMSKVHSGALILMHPTEPTEKALNQLIHDIKARNLQLGTVSDLLSEERMIKQKHNEN